MCVSAKEIRWLGLGLRFVKGVSFLKKQGISIQEFIESEETLILGKTQITSRSPRTYDTATVKVRRRSVRKGV